MKVEVAGSLDAVLSGSVSSLEEISLDQWAFALGGGGKIVEGKPRVGETLVFDHTAYIYTPEETWQVREQLPVAFLIGIGRCPDESIEVGPHDSIDLLYQTLLKRYPKGFAIAGSCTCALLAITYLKYSPIYHESVIAHAAKYWVGEEEHDCHVKLFGVVLPDLDKRMFYDNPNERGKMLCYSHTHVLKRGEARHLLTHSSISSGEFWIESL